MRVLAGDWYRRWLRRLAAWGLDYGWPSSRWRGICSWWPEARRHHLRYEVLDFHIAGGRRAGKHCLEASQINVAHTTVHVIGRNQFVDPVEIAATRNSSEEPRHD